MCSIHTKEYYTAVKRGELDLVYEHRSISFLRLDGCPPKFQSCTHLELSARHFYLNDFPTLHAQQALKQPSSALLQICLPPDFPVSVNSVTVFPVTGSETAESPQLPLVLLPWRLSRPPPCCLLAVATLAPHREQEVLTPVLAVTSTPALNHRKDNC